MYRLRLTYDQLALLSAITKNDQLKRLMLEASTMLPPGTILSINNRTLRLGEPLGSGLVGVVYQAQCLESGLTYALKRARAAFSFFREALRLEVAVGAVIARFSSLRPADIVEATPYSLLKEFSCQQTLQQLIACDAVTPIQRECFLEVLQEAARATYEYGFIVDLSPKNLCWQDGWVLLDAGPKIHRTDFSAVLENPSWERYLEYVKSKRQVSLGRSAPSVLLRAELNIDLPARRYAFLRDWWRWFPYDPALNPDYFFVTIDPQQSEDEVLFQADLNQSRISVATQADSTLTTNSIIIESARLSWRQQFPEITLADSFVEKPLDTLPISLTSEPITLAALAGESEPLGIAKALQTAIATKEVLPFPTISVQAYDHWTDLTVPTRGYAPTDIYCHSPLVTSQDFADRFLGQRSHSIIAPPFQHDNRRHCEMILIPEGNCRRAIVMVPGFRASARAAIPLTAALIERGQQGLFVPVYLGVTNSNGEMLVTAGRWETVLLWDVIDYLIECFAIQRVTIIAASHGAIAAVLVAQLHPHVDSLVLDSCVLRPLDLILYLGKVHGYTQAQILEKLRQHNLPYQPFLLSLPSRKDLRSLTLRPHSDRLLDLCGPLSQEPTIYYEGGHAATMRHNSAERGIPAICIESIFTFLQGYPN
ncbi:MAG: hypothetical protein AB1489_11385 [Acidobacteriota bacterium]